MARCDTCGNDYDKTFTVTMPDDRTYTFDSFECAIHALAPDCSQCGLRVIGHGVEDDTGVYYCSDHCRREALGVGTVPGVQPRM